MTGTSAANSSGSSKRLVALPSRPDDKLASSSSRHRIARGALAPTLPEPGDRIGPYVLEERLRKDRTGAVYLAVREGSGVTHTLKVILADRRGPTTDEARRLFRRRAELMARVDAHEGVVGIHDFGVDARLAWLAMDRVDGDTLEARIARGPLSPSESVRVVVAIGHAVQHLHRNGVVHRGLEPASIVLDADGRPRLLDSGVASEARSQEGEDDPSGAPGFRAPEQAAGRSRRSARPAYVGPRADVYALGAILYALLTGRPPIDGAIEAVLLGDPAPPSTIDPRIEPDLDAICGKALAKDPADRYPSARALAEDLERFARGEPVFILRATRGRRAHRWIARRVRRAAAAIVDAVRAIARLVLGGSSDPGS